MNHIYNNNSDSNETNEKWNSIYYTQGIIIIYFFLKIRFEVSMLLFFLHWYIS